MMNSPDARSPVSFESATLSDAVSTTVTVPIVDRLEIVALALFAALCGRVHPAEQLAAEWSKSQSGEARFPTSQASDEGVALFANAVRFWKDLIANPRDSTANKFRLYALVLCQLRQNVQLQQRSTLRDMYYCLSHAANHDQTRTNDAITSIATLCQCRREQLLVSASTRGLLGGSMQWKDTDLTGCRAGAAIDGELASLHEFARGFTLGGARERTLWATCANQTWLQEQGFRIDGPQLDMIAASAYIEFVSCTANAAAPKTILLHPATQCILVVEKDTVFQRILDLQLHLRVPCVFITGRGVPDIASRATLKLLTLLFPRLPVMGLVDCNPSGLVVLSQFQFGGTGAKTKPELLAVPHIRWIGLKPSDLSILNINSSCGAVMSARDRKLVSTLQRLAGSHELTDWLAELQLMGDAGFLKHDIESLYSALNHSLDPKRIHSFDLEKFLIRNILNNAAHATATIR